MGNMQAENNGFGGGFQTRPSGPHPPRRSYQSAFMANSSPQMQRGGSVSRSPSPLQQNNDVVKGYDQDIAEEEREWRKEKTERRVRKKLKKMLTMFNDELPSDKL